eukprot:TRINITY_DN18042_c0_g1_i1.p1 TRINITY_DN18042_c0_g1~~TRINITY_DN18042_c0_g1_i1.p1  ORF type:complete len:438 (-),score=94.15 TRINITY_DN18042_c0_g1_i1:120-1256(-)
MVASGLAAAGYKYVLIDDGWQACKKVLDSGHCVVPASRDDNGWIVADPARFPNGIKGVADALHQRGLFVGIYTSISLVTCGGFSGSLGHESDDAKAFAAWGVDFLKEDTCGIACGTRDDCLQVSARNMRDALNATGRNIVYYIDDGNPSSGMRLFNPFEHHVLAEHREKLALKPHQLIWSWGPETANMYKSWFGRGNDWDSLMDNVHMQIGNSIFQSCGALNFLDMITVGCGGSMTHDEQLTQMYLYAVLASPIILAADVRNIDNESVAILTAPEVLAVNQDAECVQGSLLNAAGAAEIWGKPLSDGRFVVVMLNRGEIVTNATLHFTSQGEFYPVEFELATLRDLYRRQDLGTFRATYTATLEPHTSVMLSVVPEFV